MKNALFISYSFPPSGGGGVKRPTKFVKYLHKNNWKVTALTVPEASYFLLDNKFMMDLPSDLKIIRVRTLISKKKTDQFRIKSLKGTEVTNKNIKGIKNKILWKIRDWFFIPDVQIVWIPFALPKAIQTIKANNIKVIWTKCPPYSVLILGGLLKMFTNKPWIIDLADPWTTASYTYFPNNKLKRINEIIEKIIFNYADKIVTVTENIADDYYKKYHHLKKNKFFIIPNGFDLDDYKELKITLNNKFTICYTGRIDLAGRDPGNFLKALLLFFKEFPLAKNDLQVLFVGGGGDYWQQNLKDNHLEDIVQFTGNVSHEKSIEFQMSSHLLLLIGGGSKYEQTGKIFEYLVAWKPILGLIREDSPAAEIIKATNTGIIISNEDCDKIKNAISHFYFKFKNGENLWKNRNQAEIDKYNWDNHARKLANIFNELSV